MKNKIPFIIFLLFFAVFFYGCTTTRMRAFVRRDANVKDYLYFPSRNIDCNIQSKGFIREIDPVVEEWLKKEFATTDLQKTVNNTKTQALLIIKDNSIVLEKYGKGYDENSIVTSFSIAKSIISAMIGTLVDTGKIRSIDEPITTYIPELLQRDKRFGQITIKHLLTMSSGIVYEEKPSLRADDTETYYNPNLRSLAITNTKIKEDPGLHFLYNNYNPILLGIIIERVTNNFVCSYLSSSIWSKINAESNATWSLDSNEDSFEKMESGINGHAVDFAHFGCLYRDGGKVNNEVVLSKKWIEESLSNNNQGTNYYNNAWGQQILKGIEGGYYGYYWYIMKRNNGENDFFALGNKGQIIYISPISNTVIVRFGEKYGSAVWKYIEAFYNISTKITQESK